MARAAQPSAKSRTSPFGRTILVHGPELLLVERGCSDISTLARRERGDAQINDTMAVNLDGGRLSEITGGSLFAEAAITIIRDLAQFPAEFNEALIDLVRDTPPDLALVLAHHGGQKGKALLDKIKKLGVEVIDCQPVKAWEVDKFVVKEVRRYGAKIDDHATQALVAAVGTDLRTLAGAVSQLHSDAGGAAITAALVKRYFEGRAEVTSFAVCDEVLAGRLEAALEKLRWALDAGVSPVLITSALAGSLRSLGRYLDLRNSQLRDAELAQMVGCPPWKLKDLARQARIWSQRRVGRAIMLVAQADANIKGAAGSSDYALERLVLELARRPQDD